MKTENKREILLDKLRSFRWKNEKNLSLEQSSAISRAENLLSPIKGKEILIFILGSILNGPRDERVTDDQWDSVSEAISLIRNLEFTDICQH